MERVVEWFLRSLSAVYLFAFASLYVQLPGLYGDHGILPVKLQLPEEAVKFGEFFRSPTVLRYIHHFGLDAETGLDMCCLIGITTALAALVWRRCLNCVTFFMLWIMYQSCFHVGQTFMWFQWDILLLETGFLAVVLAPFLWVPFQRSAWFGQHDSISLWLVKWLLFRLMFSSGVVKLTSGCPTWWGLTALTFHYETECIPTPLAWYAHQLPLWFQKLSVVMTFMIEIVIPFLFFFPSRRFVVFAAASQVFLMVAIILTGNYNFFNLLTIVLCLPLLVNGCPATKPCKSDSHSTFSMKCRGTYWLVDVIVYGSLMYMTVHYFGVSINLKKMKIDSSVVFTMMDLQSFLSTAVPLTVWIGVLSLGLEVCSAVYRSLTLCGSWLSKFTNTVGCVAFGSVASILFLISLVPYTVIDQTTQDNLPNVVKLWYSSSREFHLTSSYGLFRHMTGVGGRPEVVIEGSHHLDKDWVEYEFLYKPGNTSRQPPVVAPHQPRLDWQMWFAALGRYEDNRWFLNLIYRLLKNERTVVELIARNPFPVDAPRYIRAFLYHYHYTSFDGRCLTKDIGFSPVVNGSWWCRKKIREYLPIVSLTDPGFVNYLKRGRIFEEPGSASSSITDISRKTSNSLFNVVRAVRRAVGQPEGMLFCSLLAVIGLVLHRLTQRLFSEKFSGMAPDEFIKKLI